MDDTGERRDESDSDRSTAAVLITVGIVLVAFGVTMAIVGAGFSPGDGSPETNSSDENPIDGGEDDSEDDPIDLEEELENVTDDENGTDGLDSVGIDDDDADDETDDADNETDDDDADDALEEDADDDDTDDEADADDADDADGEDEAGEEDGDEADDEDEADDTDADADDADDDGVGADDTGGDQSILDRVTEFFTETFSFDDTG